ncbi:hypothetical protein FJU30_07940 [Affinibrenneria salicis]|uniref:Insertion element IS1 protein InsA helix-turn-helix domain-containing protein n=1 Tax=Affinibrenneria salicis TaxID=2590031 RepID=A0A5J5G2V1_9GAMM|nr:hypothetical protein FJU30_07940 [Affinibrenneria salicis]
MKPQCAKLFSKIACRYGQQTDPIRKHGTGKVKFSRYYCQYCRRTFQVNNLYNAHQPGTKEKIADVAMNGPGVRDTG